MFYVALDELQVHVSSLGTKPRNLLLFYLRMIKRHPQKDFTAIPEDLLCCLDVSVYLVYIPIVGFHIIGYMESATNSENYNSRGVIYCYAYK